MEDTIHSTSNSLFKHTTPGDGVSKDPPALRDNYISRRRKQVWPIDRQPMFPTNHFTSDNKTMTITAISGKSAKPTAPTLATTTTANGKPKYLVAVFSVLVVCIVAVLVVTVASQARNNTRQQQQIDEEQYGDNNNNNVALSATEPRHPRYISRPVTASAAQSTTETAESIILKNVKTLVMRVVAAPSATETLGNNGEGASDASRQFFQPEIGTTDKEPDSRGAYDSRNN